MYKVRIKDLESIKKQLEANNKYLASQTFATQSTVNKLIKANEKQIKLIEDEYYIN